MKNRRNTTERLELRKYNPVLRKHTDGEAKVDAAGMKRVYSAIAARQPDNTDVRDHVGFDADRRGAVVVNEHRQDAGRA